MAISCKDIANIPPLTFIFFLFFITSSKTTNTDEPPVNVQNFRGTVQPGYLFARFLGELTQTKNKLVSCSASTVSSSSSLKQSAKTPSQHPSLPTDVLQRHAGLLDKLDDEEEANKLHATIAPSTSTTKQQLSVFQNCETGASQEANLSNVKLANIVRDNCKFKKDVVSCLRDHVVGRVVATYREGLRRDLSMACCKLKYCGDSQDMLSCQACVQEDLITTEKTRTRQSALLKALTNIACSNTKYEAIQCSDLNLLAFNLLAGPASALEWSAAINVLNKCYPAYDKEIMWLFQDMVGNMSSDDSQILRDLLNNTMVTNAANQHNNPDQSAAWARMTAMSDGSVTSQAIQVWHMTPRSIAGIVIVVVLISASMFVGFWAIYQKIKYHFFPDNTIHYSQVYMQDDYPEEEEDDFDENDVYYR